MLIEAKNGGKIRIVQKGDKNPNAGRKAGGKNRTTIAREVLKANPKKIFSVKGWAKIMDRIPGAELMNIEQLMTFAVSMRAIEREDTNAYVAVMNNAYKPHAQEIDTTTNLQPKIEIVKTYNIPATVVDVAIIKPDTSEENRPQ